MDAVACLRNRILTGGLACCGYERSLRALEIGQADELILAPEGITPQEREKLVHAAAKSSAQVEIVGDATLMEDFEGVGCLLRYELYEEPDEAMPVEENVA